MRYLKPLLFLILTLWQTSCQESNVEITNCWKVTLVKTGPLQHMVAYPDFNEPQRLKGCFLRFYPNKTAAVWQKEAGYSVCNWRYDLKNDAFYLESPEAGTGLQFRITRQEGPSAEFSVLNSANHETGVRLMVALSRLYEDRQMDLLHPNVNEWRIRPRQPESQQALEKRVWGMVNFLVNYFELIERKNQTYFETPILQSPFRFYSGGIGLTRKDEIPEDWAATFYNRQDAEKAYVILLDAFERDVEYPKNTPKLTEAYLKVLQAVRFNLE